jgi:hypothetical protein
MPGCYQYSNHCVYLMPGFRHQIHTMMKPVGRAGDLSRFRKRAPADPGIIHRDGTTGKTLWTHPVVAPLSGMAVSDGILYAADAKGNVYAPQT